MHPLARAGGGGGGKHGEHAVCRRGVEGHVDPIGGPIGSERHFLMLLPSAQRFLKRLVGKLDKTVIGELLRRQYRVPRERMLLAHEEQ